MSELSFNDEQQVRTIAREEIASLCGLVLRRAREENIAARAGAPSTDAVPGWDALASIFGEALRDFSGPTAPGE